MTRLLGLIVLPKQHGFLYLCITTGFSHSLVVKFSSRLGVLPLLMWFCSLGCHSRAMNCDDSIYTCVVSYRLHQLWLYYFLGWFHWATSSNDTVLSCCLGAGGWSGIPRISSFLPFLSVLSFWFPLGGGGGGEREMRVSRVQNQ